MAPSCAGAAPLLLASAAALVAACALVEPADTGLALAFSSAGPHAAAGAEQQRRRPFNLVPGCTGGGADACTTASS